MISKKKILNRSVSFLFILSSFFCSHAQERNKDFKFRYDQNLKTENSRYQYIQVIDSRADKTHFGIVQKGMFNKIAKVVASPSIQEQLQTYLTSIVTNSQTADTLILQIRRLSFSESSGSFGEKGFFTLRANLYHKAGVNYYPLQLIDSSFQVSGIDVTNKLLNKGSKILDDYIRKNLAYSNRNGQLSLEDVLRIDYKEKESLPFYAAEHLTDGIYMNYENLKYQKPDYPLQGEWKKNGEIKYYYYINDKNKKVKLKDRSIFAVIEKDKAFISTENGYNELFMENDEYYFIGFLPSGGNSSFFVGAGFFGGAIGSFGMTSIGGGFGSSGKQSEYKVKIDHMDGKFEKVEELH